MDKIGIFGWAVVGQTLKDAPPVDGNDAEAKGQVAQILEAFGWEAADMGTATAARAIEPLCQLWCIPGFRQNMWTHAFAMLTR